MAEVSASRGRIGHGGVRGYVHVIGRSDKGVLRNGGQGSCWGLGGSRVIRAILRGVIVVGVRGI